MSLLCTVYMSLLLLLFLSSKKRCKITPNIIYRYLRTLRVSSWSSFRNQWSGLYRWLHLKIKEEKKSRITALVTLYLLRSTYHAEIAQFRMCDIFIRDNYISLWFNEVWPNMIHWITMEYAILNMPYYNHHVRDCSHLGMLRTAVQHVFFIQDTACFQCYAMNCDS